MPVLRAAAARPASPDGAAAREAAAAQPVRPAGLSRRRRLDRLFRALTLLATLTGVAVLVLLLADVARDGLRHLDGRFLTGFPSRRPERAGIYPALIGSLWVIGLATPVVLLVGVGTAVYLEEYRGSGRWSRWLELNIRNLAGVPAVVYGMLGLSLFVRGLGLGEVVLAGALTMALLILPVVIVSAQEAIRSVPPSLRHAAYALGATRWQVVSRVVLPAALPGILTGVILAVSRAIGEAAPLILVGAVAFVRHVPAGPLDPYTVLPIQIFNWIALPQRAFHELAAAAILVLLGTLLALNGMAVYLRNRFQVRW